MLLFLMQRHVFTYPEAAEASRRSNQGPAALLHCYRPSQAGFRVCLPGLALGFNCWAV